MDLAPLLALPLVGGYAFSTIWSGSLYYSSRESGHRIYFRAVFYAVFVFACSVNIHVIFFSDFDWYRAFISWANGIIGGAPISASIHGRTSKIFVLGYSLFLGPILGHILNLPRTLFLNIQIPKTEIKPFLAWERLILFNAIKTNDFEKLINRAFIKNSPILITLSSGKVYVGWAVSAPTPSASRRALRVLPMLSGYRDKDTQRVHFITNYYEVLSKVKQGDDVLKHLELEDFEVVLPVEQICIAHPFDVSAYLHFQGKDEPAQDK